MDRNCPHCHASSEALRSDGFYARRSDRRRVRKFRCSKCGRYCSNATFGDAYRQKKRQINFELFKLLGSGVSMRRCARVMGITRRTVERKLLYWARVSEREHSQYLDSLDPLTALTFDEMETHEHSKWKPLSLPLIVTPERKIVGFDVCRMPARGIDAAKARAKYGHRPDERYQTLRKLLEGLAPKIAPGAVLKSDEKSMYAPLVRRVLPQAVHRAYKGKRGCIVGQGELKKTGFDPLFALNHTAAMLRYSTSRLVRRTWSTTKRRDRLKAHLWLYVRWHNQVLTA